MHNDKSPRAKSITRAAERIRTALRAKGGLTKADIENTLSVAFEGRGDWDNAEAHEACEAATTQFILQHAAAMHRATAGDPGRADRLIRRIADAEPRLRGRARRHDDCQHHATAVEIAWTMAVAAGIRAGDRVLDPSAGTGALLAMAQAAQPETGELRGIEIDPDRAAVLQTCSPRLLVHEGNTFEEERWSDDNDVVLVNPPFSARYGEGRRRRNEDMRHLRAAGERTRAGGRIVALLGGNTRPGNKAWQNLVGDRIRLVWSIRIERPLMRNREVAASALLCMLERTPEDGRHDPTAAPTPNSFEALVAHAREAAARWIHPEQGHAG